MKKLLHIILFLFVVMSLGACHKKPVEINYDASMLYGKWQEGTVYERYYDSLIERVLPNGDTVHVNGTTWDVSDDVTEDEAQLFNWSVTGATLKHEHVGAFVMVPKLYTITLLTSNNLVYKDDYGVLHYYSKVE
jgi:hypothetical protein